VKTATVSLVDRPDHRLLTGLRQGGQCALQLEPSRQPRRTPSTPTTAVEEVDPRSGKATNRWLQRGPLRPLSLAFRSLGGRQRADGPQTQPACRCQNRRKPGAQTVVTRQTGPSQFRFPPEEPPAQPDQHVEPVTGRELTTPAARDRRTSAENRLRLSFQRSCRPARRGLGGAGQKRGGPETGPDDKLVMGEHICWGLGLRSLQGSGF